jgi:hypothetical protein
MKLLGKLEVWETEDTDCVSGLSSKLQINGEFRGKEFKIVLCPNSSVDTKGLEKREQLQILAHELGHFVGHILNLPSHKDTKKRQIRNKLLGLPEDAVKLLPMEKEAWQVAEIAVPGVSKSEAYTQSIASYERHDREFMKALETAPFPVRLMLED